MLEQFPQALKESRRWVCFDAVKTPINPATGKNAMQMSPPHGVRWRQRRLPSPALACAVSGCF